MSAYANPDRLNLHDEMTDRDTAMFSAQLNTRIQQWLKTDAVDLAALRTTDMHLDHLFEIETSELWRLGVGRVVRVACDAFLALVHAAQPLESEYQCRVRFELVAHSNRVLGRKPATRQDLLTQVDTVYPPTLELMTWRSSGMLPDLDEEYRAKLGFTLVSLPDTLHEYTEVRWPDASIGRQVVISYYPQAHRSPSHE
jgi:hypothetical protein